MAITNYQREWRKAHPEKVKQQNRDYIKRRNIRRRADPTYNAALLAKRAAWRSSHKTAAQTLREKVLTKYGRKCNNPACQWLNADGSRGCVDTRCIQIDHVHGGGKQELKSLHQHQYHKKVLADAEGNYQLLCANCNWIKRSEKREI